MNLSDCIRNINKPEESLKKKKRKRKRAQINKIRNEREVTTDITETHRIKKDYY